MQAEELSTEADIIKAYRQRCIEYVDALPAATPWCEYLHVLQALSAPLNDCITLEHD